MKFILFTFISLILSSCATRCYTVEFLDVTYKDIFNNELTIRSRGMFTKELDTTFIKNNIFGLTLNGEQPNDALTFKYTIHQIEKIRTNTYMLLINSKRIINGQQQAITGEECTYYFLLTEKIKDKTELKKIARGGGCYPMDNKQKKRLAEKLLK